MLADIVSKHWGHNSVCHLIRPLLNWTGNTADLMKDDDPRSSTQMGSDKIPKGIRKRGCAPKVIDPRNRSPPKHPRSPNPPIRELIVLEKIHMYVKE